MPNWCEGQLKVRGTKEAISRFVLEGLVPVSFLGEENGALTPNEWGEVQNKGNTWIKGTRRGFVDNLDVYLDDLGDTDHEIEVFDARFAWSITPDDLLKISAEYGIDLKIYAFERGMEFNLDIEIVNGEIVRADEITFDDYMWDCVCPSIGG